MRANELANQLAMQAESVAAHLLPTGKRDGSEWVCGDVDGNPGKSLKVCVTGTKAGLWRDFAEDKGGDLLSLWCETRNLSVSEAMAEVRGYLGIALTNTERQETSLKSLAAPQIQGPSKYLLERGISEETQHRYRVGAIDNEVVFPSYVDQTVVWIKYRSITDKSKMRVEKGGKPVLFGWQAIPKKQRSVVITEGEIDALSWKEMGYYALSVPNGAQGFNWIETEYNRLERFDRIYVAFDSDEAGRAGARELIDRLGNERCLLVNTGNFKDANEILQAGADATPYIRDALSQDPEELKPMHSFEDAVIRGMAEGFDSGPGFNTPFRKLEGKLRFRIHEASILNGVNGHGKSQMVGQFILDAIKQGWKPTVFSGELRAEILISRLIYQATADRDCPESKSRPTFQWLKDKAHIFDLVGTAKAKRLLEVFEYAHKRYGSNFFIIDSLMKCGLAEDDYNGQKAFIEAVTEFKNRFPVHVLIVTHARKTMDEDKPTGKMDVKGTGAITDLVDTVMTIWRNKPKERAKFEDEDAYEIKFKHEPDALLFCSKQRNGDWEGSAKLWWHRRANQFIQTDTGEAQVYYTQLRAV